MKLFKKSYSCMANTPSLLYLLMMASVFSACRGPEVKEKKNENPVAASAATLSPDANGKYTIDTKESVVTYKGSMLLTAKGSHTGYVYLSTGELIIEKGRLTGGHIEVDMNTIADKDHGSDNNLVRHYKSPDFFDVEKFPFAAFNVTLSIPTNGETVNVTGNLTIKGVTRAVTFPATLRVTDGLVHATGTLAIDRTQWAITYKSGKSGLHVLADDIISDTIEFEVKLVARK